MMSVYYDFLVGFWIGIYFDQQMVESSFIV